MIGLITIPLNTSIFKIEKLQGVMYKSPIIEIIDIMSYNDFINIRDLFFKEFTKDVLNLNYVKEQTPEICLEAVKQNGWNLKYVKEQIPEFVSKLLKIVEDLYNL